MSHGHGNGMSVKLTGAVVRILALPLNYVYEADQVIIFSIPYPLIHKMGMIILTVKIKWDDT